VSDDNFGKRLLTQIKVGVNRNFISLIRDLYHTDELGFVGLLLLLISGTSLFFSVIAIEVLTSSQHDIESYMSLMNSASPIILFFFILMGAGAVMLMIGRFIIHPATCNFQPITPNANPLNPPINKKIFVIHGHVSETKDAVINFLKDLDLNPIVLKDVPNRGKTIIEKVEYYVKQTSFAIAILTKDDFGVAKKDFDMDLITQGLDALDATNIMYNVRETGYDNIEVEDIKPFFDFVDLSKEMSSKTKPRARQNVIFELGLTFGKLDRHKVVMLYEGSLELPSDIDGLAYYSLNNDWKRLVIQDLLAAKILDKNCSVKFNKSPLDYLFNEGDISEIQLTLKDFDELTWTMATPRRVDHPYSGWQFLNTYTNDEKKLKVGVIIHRFLTIDSAKKEGFHPNRENYALTQKDGRLFAPHVGDESYGYISDSNVAVATFRSSNLLVTTCFYVTKNRNSISDAEHYAQIIDQKIKRLANQRFFE